MEERTRSLLYFFVGIILPIILVVVSFLPFVANILLTILALVWFGFAILLLSPAKD